MALSEFDRELIRLASGRLGVRDAAVWHPGLMYRLFRAFWYGDRSLDFLLRHTDFRIASHVDACASIRRCLTNTWRSSSIPVPRCPTPTRTAQPCSSSSSASPRECRSSCSTPAWSVDEHHDYAFEGFRNVTTLRPSLDPKTNLGLQTRVIAGARQFVGTCGGLAWLAPLLGVDTLAVYEDDRYLTAHLYAAKYAYRRTGGARFSTLNLKALRAVERCIH